MYLLCLQFNAIKPNGNFMQKCINFAETTTQIFSLNTLTTHVALQLIQISLSSNGD